jgi:hypothetical protein
VRCIRAWKAQLVLTPVRFRFTPVGTATWQIDDVYIDPRRR